MKKLSKLMFLSFLLLTGCSNKTSSDVNSTTTSSSSNSSSQTPSSSSVVSSKIEAPEYEGDIKFDGYYKATKQSITYADSRKTSYYNHDLNAIGDQKVLVVPVKFKDSTLADTTYGGSDLVKSHIEKGFFGNEEETGWESLSSYYKKSSYGKLNISGKVTDWCELDLTYLESEALNTNGIKGTDGVQTHSTVQIARMVGKWYLENYDDASEFDLDNDGYIDLLWMIYDWTSENKGENDWAHVYWDSYNSVEGTATDPIPFTFAWAGISFLYEGQYYDENNNALVDAHTIIHETGHALGLTDYYDYGGKTSYAGGLDMMDVNIGDHTGLSKYLLGWTDPYVVTGDCEITLRPFEQTGDFILIKDEWNHSANDEYLLVEFYTPTGLNKLDSESPYANKYPIHYQNPGIKVYHVDARLGHYVNFQFNGYTDEIKGLNDGYTNCTLQAHSNTASRRLPKTPEYELYHLLENVKKPVLHNGRNFADDNSLFHEGDIFDPYDFEFCFDEHELFNDGEYIDFAFEVISMNENETTLKFTRISEA